ncbi:hypothetical protein [Actinomadura monticuli]|uniref:Uncharacterized protein n=1 Tax=Actinomadura monticuli TaxID=3097367 RepID=A0ABV4Q8R0_9ACTN
MIFGRWIFWPRIPRYGGAPPARGAWDRAGRRIAARPRLVWVGGLVVLGALASGCLGIHTGLDRAHFLASTPSSTVGERLLAEHYPGGQGRPVQVITAKPASVTGALSRAPGVARVGTPQTSADGRLTRLEVVLTSSLPDSLAAKRTVRGLRDAVPDALFGASTAGEIDPPTGRRRR